MFINTGSQIYNYDSLAKLTEEWEDYEEPKEYWTIDTVLNKIRPIGDKSDEEWIRFESWAKAIGNYFETREEAEKAVEKLKAWKRLKDKGFRFKGWNCALQELYFDVPDTFYDRPDMVGEAISEETTKDLDLLFGGEE